uniref:Solute carrier family 12 member 2 n=1 Tax=Panagrolaimus sp. ES5 TaxID=591445 RepID=A0AC34FZQ6_9BILA
MNDAQVFNLVSLWSPLVTAGVLTSTLSSALLSLVAAPKIFQAVAQDKLFPYIDTFSTGFRNNAQPQKAYILAFFISCIVVLVGNLNAIAPIISNFYLSTYTLINFACFDTSFAQSPGFRPSFKYYHQWVSLIGAILCVCIMFVVSYINALITFMFFGLLFFYMSKRKPDVNWGTSKQAHAYRNAFQYIQKLEKINEHVKNYRPQILVLSGNPASRPSLIDFGHAITKGHSLLICGHVIQHDMADNINMFIQNTSEQIRSWFQYRNLKALYFPAADKDFQKGVQYLLQGAGLGKLKPNILLIGFKHSWESESIDGLNEINGYFNLIISAFDSQMGVCILRNSNHGLNFSNLILKNPMKLISKDYTEKGNSKFSKKVKNALNSLKNTKESKNENVKMETLDTLPSNSTKDSECENNSKNDIKNRETLTKQFTVEQTEILASINQFRINVEKGIIDVWWLYDDGGLSLLLPYLLTQNKSYLEVRKEICKKRKITKILGSKT